MAARVAIVGGGAAGMMAALAARRGGARAVLYERNKRLGIKILISGGGKCNITHEAAPMELEEGFIAREARFLRYAFHEFTPAQLLEMLHAEGLETFTRPNGRVFPVSGRAEDVLAAFERILARAGVEVRTNALVQGIELNHDAERDRDVARGVHVGGHLERFDAVIVTTGGMSYRKVGTTGDGIDWGRGSGHVIEPVRAALAPIYFPVLPPAEWQGVALRDVQFRLETAEGGSPQFKRTAAFPVEWSGDLLLTHRGVSGPVVLEVSRAAALLREQGHRVLLCVDLLPDTGEEELRRRWEARLQASGRTEVQTFVEGILPRALVPFFLDAAGIAAGTKLSEVSRADRAALLGTLKRWVVGEVGEVPMDRGEVTAGGVALAEVSSRTMESVRVSGLYFAGEVLDIAGCVGGYNLQAAFSTGHVAGTNAALEASSTFKIQSSI